MAAGAEFSPPYAILESGFSNSKDNNNSNVVSTLKDVNLDDSDNVNQLSNAKPPRHISLVRHSMSSFALCATADVNQDGGSVCSNEASDENSGFQPVFRSGSCAERGPKQYMEDKHVCIDNLSGHLDASDDFPSPGAFYGVFDGHGGTDAASFVCKNILKYIVEDPHFPACVEKAVRSAFVKADYAFADSSALDISSGTTALTALIFERTMLIANAGDCRAVLGKRGKAVELSKDHKPNCSSEKLRIEKLGGVVYDGYLNGQLSVARALGDWHMKGPKGSAFPLSSEPELQETVLTEDDEFLLLACDGLWDVMSSQCAVTIARRELMAHNDPERCSRELVREALKRNTCDNLTVIVVCFSSDPPPRIEIRPTRRRSISAEGLNLLKGVLDGIS
ncbi:putative protein phosphatase 2C 27 [Silene latifolia]|uniref:putative protein phosphatase 2C 27 n=1 Tax=Silene latifolia TaxID=37657 RepID=UPI003D77D64F